MVKQVDNQEDRYNRGLIYRSDLFKVREKSKTLEDDLNKKYQGVTFSLANPDTNNELGNSKKSFNLLHSTLQTGKIAPKQDTIKNFADKFSTGGKNFDYNVKQSTFGGSKFDMVLNQRNNNKNDSNIFTKRNKIQNASQTSDTMDIIIDGDYVAPKRLKNKLAFEMSNASSENQKNLKKIRGVKDSPKKGFQKRRGQNLIDKARKQLGRAPDTQTEGKDSMEDLNPADADEGKSTESDLLIKNSRKKNELNQAKEKPSRARNKQNSLGIASFFERKSKDEFKEIDMFKNEQSKKSDGKGIFTFKKGEEGTLNRQYNQQQSEQNSSTKKVTSQNINTFKIDPLMNQMIEGEKDSFEEEDVKHTPNFGHPSEDENKTVLNDADKLFNEFDQNEANPLEGGGSLTKFKKSTPEFNHFTITLDQKKRTKKGPNNSIAEQNAAKNQAKDSKKRKLNSKLDLSGPRKYMNFDKPEIMFSESSAKRSCEEDYVPSEESNSNKLVQKKKKKKRSPGSMEEEGLGVKKKVNKNSKARKKNN